MKEKRVKKVLTPLEKAERHGVSVGSRIPLPLFNLLDDEALKLEQTVSKRISAWLHKVLESADEFEKKLKKVTSELKDKFESEIGMLKQQLADLAKSSIKGTEAELIVFKTLQKNRLLLEKHLNRSGSVTRTELEKEGFNFNYANSFLTIGMLDYSGVVDFAYRLEGQVVFIVKFEPKQT